MINQLIKKTAESFNKSTVSQPAADAAKAPAKPKIEPAPMDNSPRGLAKAAAEAAGFVLGDQYQGKLTSHKPQNRNLRWATIEHWGELVLFSVQNADDWSPSENIWGHYAGPNASGQLLFENRNGIRRNKFGRRR